MDNKSPSEEIQAILKGLTAEDIEEIRQLEKPPLALKHLFQAIEALLTDDSGAFVTDWNTANHILKDDPMHKLSQVRCDGLAKDMLDYCGKILKGLDHGRMTEIGKAAGILTAWAKCVYKHAVKAEVS